ncbi:unnamed protein product [Enterobius vermicularis]|uniref:SRP40_C domain-containing protein n=1 Tax=Enterobius vermicularis TaxID=51028 RepID=A0A0N4V450_ENTVE|nr:unnamed protein product [Enterobius vermicularis]
MKGYEMTKEESSSDSSSSSGDENSIRAKRKESAKKALDKMAARRSSTSSSDSTSSGDEGTVKKNSFQAAEKEGKKDSASKKFSSSESSSSDKEVTIQIKGSKLSKRSVILPERTSKGGNKKTSLSESSSENAEKASRQTASLVMSRNKKQEFEKKSSSSGSSSSSDSDGPDTSVNIKKTIKPASGEKTGEKTLSLDRSGISEGRQGGFTSVDSALQNKIKDLQVFISALCYIAFIIGREIIFDFVYGFFVLTKRQTEPYRRVKIKKEQLDAKFRDNSYKSDHDPWGQKAHETFKNVQGKGFRHEKTKKKRGSYGGGSISMKAIQRKTLWTAIQNSLSNPCFSVLSELSDYAGFIWCLGDVDVCVGDFGILGVALDRMVKVKEEPSADEHEQKAAVIPCADKDFFC